MDLNLLIDTLQRLPHSEPTVEIRPLAESMLDAVSRSKLGEARALALLVTIGHFETKFSARIAEGRCRPRECDRGKARGLWQVHRNWFNQERWVDLQGDVGLQVRVSMEQVEKAYWQCSRAQGTDWLHGTLNAYAGKRCDARWAGLEPRVELLRATLARLSASPQHS